MQGAVKGLFLLRTTSEQALHLPTLKLCDKNDKKINGHPTGTTKLSPTSAYVVAYHRCIYNAQQTELSHYYGSTTEKSLNTV